MQFSPQIIQMLAQRFQTPGINPNEPQPGVPPQQTQPRWMQGLNSPLGQIGLRMLAGSRDARGNPVGLGNAAGGAVLGYQQDQAGQAQADVQRRYMEAQIKKMGMPDPQRQPELVIVTGPDGKPRYALPEEANGQQPYIAPPGSAQAPGEVEIARVLNDPNVSDAVKKDLRSLLDRKYRDPAGEPLVAVQLEDGRTVLAPRSQAAGATPAATRENPSEGERGAANYFGRMDAAEKLLGDYTPGLMDYIAADRMMKGGPTSGALSNMALSQEGQKYYQAAADWVRAKLRKESGAVISPEEMAQEIKTYFPMPGDNRATITQKAKARQQAKEGMKDMGGRALPQAPAATNPADPLGIR